MLVKGATGIGNHSFSTQLPHTMTHSHANNGKWTIKSNTRYLHVKKVRSILPGAWHGVEREEAISYYLNQWCLSCWRHVTILGHELILPGTILFMGSVNERRRYKVTPLTIGWAHTQNDPWLPTPYPTCRCLLLGSPREMWTSKHSLQKYISFGFIFKQFVCPISCKEWIRSTV